jgi:predicted Zn-dependent protease
MERMKELRKKLMLRDALRVRSAEMWLRLGEPAQALMELQKLPKRAQQDPLVTRTFEEVYKVI